MCDVCNMVSTYMLGIEYSGVFLKLFVFYHTHLEHQNQFMRRKNVNFYKRASKSQFWICGHRYIRHNTVLSMWGYPLKIWISHSRPKHICRLVIIKAPLEQFSQSFALTEIFMCSWYRILLIYCDVCNGRTPKIWNFQIPNFSG